MERVSRQWILVESLQAVDPSGESLQAVDPSGESLQAVVQAADPSGKRESQTKTSNVCGEGVNRALAATEEGFRNNRNVVHCTHQPKIKRKRKRHM